MLRWLKYVSSRDQSDLVAITEAPNDFVVVTSWTNGRKAVVHLLENMNGDKVIMKVYRPGFLMTMIREYFMTRYLSGRLSGSPRVIGFKPWRKTLFLSYVNGQRVLEWVLERFGEADLKLADFQSFHGLDPDRLDGRVDRAFRRLRESRSEEARRIKDAIRASYATLHRCYILHGSPDPRNMIYDGDRVSIIDFDHTRLSLDPAKIDYRGLEYWYGLRRAN